MKSLITILILIRKKSNCTEKKLARLMYDKLIHSIKVKEYIESIKKFPKSKMRKHENSQRSFHNCQKISRAMLAVIILKFQKILLKLMCFLYENEKYVPLVYIKQSVYIKRNTKIKNSFL